MCLGFMFRRLLGLWRSFQARTVDSLVEPRAIPRIVRDGPPTEHDRFRCDACLSDHGILERCTAATSWPDSDGEEEFAEQTRGDLYDSDDEMDWRGYYGVPPNYDSDQAEEFMRNAAECS